MQLFQSYSFGQTTFKKNSVYLEAAGNGIFASVNYERQLTKKPGLGVRLGVGFYTENAFYLTIPVGINYLFALRNNKSFIDAGVGVTFAKIDGELFSTQKILTVKVLETSFPVLAIDITQQKT